MTPARRVTALAVEPVIEQPVAPPAPPEDRLITVETVAERLDVVPQTIYRMVARKVFPQPIRLDGGQGKSRARVRQARVRWSSNEVSAWIARELAKRRAG